MAFRLNRVTTIEVTDCTVELASFVMHKVLLSFKIAGVKEVRINWVNFITFIETYKPLTDNELTLLNQLIDLSQNISNHYSVTNGDLILLQYR